MRARGVVLLLVSVVFLAGCTDGPAEGPDNGSESDVPTAAPSPTALFPIDNSGSGCNEGFVASLISFDQARRSLPPGFAPADASALFGFPVPTTMAAAFFTVFACATSGYNNTTLVASDLGILVEAPTVEGVDEPVVNDFYVVHSYTNNSRLVEAYTAIGANFTAMEPAVSLMALPGGAALVSGDIYDAEGIVAEYRIDGAKPDTFTTTARFWQDTPQGLFYTYYALDAVPIAQGNVECSIRPGSFHAEVLGAAACPKSSLGLVLIGVSWVSEVVFLPGIHAAA